MAISTVGGATTSATVSQPIGFTKVLKQGYSSLGVLNYTPAQPLASGTYGISVAGTLNSNATIYASLGSATVFANATQCALTTNSSSASASILALDKTTVTPTTSSTLVGLNSPNLYSVGVYNWAYNGAFKFKDRIHTYCERYVISVDANTPLSSQTTSNVYIGTTYANALNVGAACDNFAVVTNNTGSTNISNAYSTDGINWNTYNWPSTCSAMKGGGNTIIAYNYGSTTYYTTTNGYTWTTRTFPFTPYSVAYNPVTATWYATQNASTTMWKSVDNGINWTSFTIASGINSQVSFSSYNWKVFEYAGNGYMFLNVDYNYNQGFITNNLETASAPLAWQNYGSGAVAFYNRFGGYTNYNSSVCGFTFGSGSAQSTTFFSGDATQVGLGIQMNNLGSLVLVKRASTTVVNFASYSPTTLPAIITLGTTSMEVLN